jgi:hypothetical protein
MYTGCTGGGVQADIRLALPFMEANMRIVDIRVSVLCWSLGLALGALGAGCVNERGFDEDANPALAISAISAITVDPDVDEAPGGGSGAGCTDPKTCGEPAPATNGGNGGGCTDPTTCGEPARPGGGNGGGCTDPVTCGEPARPGGGSGSGSGSGCTDPVTCGEPIAPAKHVASHVNDVGSPTPVTECPNPNECTEHSSAPVTECPNPNECTEHSSAPVTECPDPNDCTNHSPVPVTECPLPEDCTQH